MDLPETNEDLLFHSVIPEFCLYKCAEIYDEERDTRKRWDSNPSSRNSRCSSQASSRSHSRRSSRARTTTSSGRQNHETVAASNCSECSSNSSTRNSNSRASSVSAEDPSDEFDPLTPVGSPKCRSARRHHQDTLNKDSANYTMASLLNYIESIGEIQNIGGEDDLESQEFQYKAEENVIKEDYKSLNIATLQNGGHNKLNEKFFVEPVHSGSQTPPESIRKHSRKSSIGSEGGQSNCSNASSSPSLISNLFSRLRLSRKIGTEELHHPSPESLPQQDLSESSTLSFTDQILGKTRQHFNGADSKSTFELSNLKVEASNSTIINISDSQEQIFDSFSKELTDNFFQQNQSAEEYLNDSSLNKSLNEELFSAFSTETVKLKKFSSIKNFLSSLTAYDMIPSSSKLVILDTRLNVRKAFFVLVHNGIRAAPLWSTREQKFVGMFTVSDFIKVIYKRYTNQHSKMQDPEKQSISQWRKWLKDDQTPFVFVEPNMTLLESLKILLSSRVHRIPILDPESGNILHSFTYLRLLNYLYNNFDEIKLPDYISKTLFDLPLGTYEDDGMCKVHHDATLVTVLGIFVAKNVSAIPVVDENNKLVNIYAKYDAINLAETKSYENLGVNVTEALQYKKNKFSDALTCHKSDTLEHIIKKIVENQVHRLIIVDNEFRVEGIIALSDLLYFLIQQD